MGNPFQLKKCFIGNHFRFVFLFQKNKSKYQRESDLGVLSNCRFCEIKRHIKLCGTFTMSEGFVKRSVLGIIKHDLK
jgi:hypothetical protein